MDINNLQIETASAADLDLGTIVIETLKLCIVYGSQSAVIDVSLRIPAHKVTAIIGPSGCGKSTLLRHLNRMNEFIQGVSATGQVLHNSNDIYSEGVDATEVRRRIGMVFQKPNPFPDTIFENIAWGPRLNGTNSASQLSELVERSLRQANLWDEVSHRLEDNAMALSGGQQQRLCIARALAMEPEIILMDEPCASLDPASSTAIEELILSLKNDFTIVMVTHDMQRATRISDYTAFMQEGKLIEFGETKHVFSTPQSAQTKSFITGKSG